jgi:hypothetical protein
MRDGQIVEHWGGPHCQNGVGLVTGAAAKDAFADLATALADAERVA